MGDASERGRYGPDRPLGSRVGPRGGFSAPLAGTGSALRRCSLWPTRPPHWGLFCQTPRANGHRWSRGRHERGPPTIRRTSLGPIARSGPAQWAAGERHSREGRATRLTPGTCLLSGVLDVQTQQIRPRASMALRHAQRRRRVCDLPSRVLPASAVEPTLLAGPIRSALDGPPSRSIRPAPSTRPHRLTSPLFSSPDRSCTAAGRRTIRSSLPARTRWLPHRGARSLRPPVHSPLPHPAAR